MFRRVSGLGVPSRLALCALALAGLAAPPSSACSICGCDPSNGTLGLDRPAQSELRVALEDRYLQKESGSGEAAEAERENRLNLRVQYALPVPRLALQLEIPVYLWKAHFGPTGVEDDTSRGLGDLSISARYELLKLGGIVPRHVLALTATLKVPTGANGHLASVDTAGPDEHKQLGTGTWDELFGAFYTYGDFPTIAYAGLSARINSTNARGNHFGSALFGTVGVRRSFLESRKLLLSLDGQFRNAGKDTTPARTYDPDSGGLLVYASVSAGYALTDALLVRATVQLPIGRALNGTQVERPVGVLSLAYDFAL